MHTTRLCISMTVLSFMLISSSHAANQITPKDNDLAHKIDEISREAKRNAEDTAILRRDEINYRLSKELLKETYESNLQRLNQTVTIASSVVAFIFAVFGFFGYRNVGKLKEDYLKELQEARTLKNSLEVEIDVLRKKQEQAETEIDKLRKTQGTKIELLEIVEKASTLFRNGNYEWAIEHAKAGLEINPTYKHLLSIQAICEFRIGNYSSAAELYRKLIENSQIAPGDILNYAELLLFMKNIKDYEELYARNKNVFEDKKNENLMAFFNMLRAVVQDDLVTAKRVLQSFAEKCSPEASPKLGTWNLADANNFINAMPPSEMKTIVENASKFFMGTITTKVMLEALET